MGPIHFREIFKEKVWGGQNLARLLGKRLPVGKKIGESWELSDFGEDRSVVAGGEFPGEDLASLLANHKREISGGEGVKEFGLLFKFLDAAEPLSVQVHPQKHEAWYILEARAGAKLYLGLKEGLDRRHFEAAVAEGTVEQCLADIEPQASQCYYLPAGLTHALGGGLVVAEIQTTEQITYRVYDWQRGRPIQVQLSLETINFQARPEQICPPPQQPGQVQMLLNSEHFSIERALWPAEQSLEITPGQMQVWMILAGKAHCRYQDRIVRFDQGQTILLPACWGGEIQIDQQICALITRSGWVEKF